VALVLAIEPDLRQAEILKRIVHEKVKAEVVIVDSRDAAMEAMRAKMPDVMLLSALLSPRDEDELVAHLRTLDNAEHLQTHTIPQLASGGGKGKSAGGGLLKAFRRKKNAEPEVAGCDPEHFADEIRVFLEQAEQKRFELAEQLKYRPAIKPAIAVPQPATTDEAPSPGAAAATTSWDSPFEWRKNDAIPLPAVAFEEEQPAPEFMPEMPPEPPSIDPSPAPSTLDRWAALDPPAPYEPGETAMQTLPVHEPEAVAPIEVDPVPAQEFEHVTPAEAMVPWSPDPAAEIAAAPIATKPESQTPIDAPELFETFVPPPIAVDAIPEITFESVVQPAIEPVTFDLTPFEEPLPVEETPAAAIATPEEIESYGRAQLPVQDVHWIADAPTLDQDAALPFEVVATPAPEVSVDFDSEQEVADSGWSAVEAQDTTISTTEPLEIDLDSLAVSVEETTEVETDLEPAAPAMRPPSLGPLATWARLEGTNQEERRPGTDMREIIDRLAVPSHVAGVSYARGVRIRRVRVAGSRDRRRPLDHKGPVILSRRALAETRSATA
jgi:hypothetical protein